jgi:hypothetical protein
MRATISQTKKKDYSKLIILCLIIISILFEFFAGDAFFNGSHDSILSAQKFFSETFNIALFDESKVEKLNPSEDKLIKMEYLISYLNDNKTSDDETKNNNLEKNLNNEILASEVIHLINTNIFYLILCAVLFCFVNIYKVYILSMTIFLSNFVSSTLSFIFHSPKPYMAFYKIKPIVTFNEWGSPNSQILVLVSFALSLYKVLTENKYMERKLWAKILVIIFLAAYSFIDIFLLFCSGNCSYNQIIFSLFMAVIIFVFIFYSLKVDLNKSKQFYDFMKFKIHNYLVINLLLFTFQVVLNLFIIDKGDLEYYTRNATEQASLMPTNSITDMFCKYRNMFYLNSGNFCNLIFYLMNIVAFISVKADLHIIYKNNFNSWSENNFEKPRIDSLGNNNLLDNSGVNDYANIEQSQWNHLGAFLGLVRMVLVVIVTLVILSLFIWISSWSDSEIYSFIFLISIPTILVVCGIFYFYKPIISAIKLGKKPKIKSKKLNF